MAGEGKRFSDAGINLPKPLINIDGLPMFIRALDSLLKLFTPESLQIIMLAKHQKEHGVKEIIDARYPSAKTILLEKTLNGPIYSAYEGILEIDNDSIVIIADCDQAIKSTELPKKLKSLSIKPNEIGLIWFKSKNPNYSYILDKLGSVQIFEKTVVSNRAISGVYIFGSKELYVKGYEIVTKKMQGQEIYMSALINELLKIGTCYTQIAVDEISIYGTPEDLGLI